MKIDNINILTKIQKVSTDTKKTELETESFEKILKNAQNSSDEQKLKLATQQFEEMFINMMMKNMRSTIKDGGFIEKSYAREMFEGMLDEEIAKEVVKGDGIGIAQMMYQQLSKIIKPDEEK